MVFKNIIYRQFFWLTFRVTDTKFMLVLPSLLFTQSVRGRFSFRLAQPTATRLCVYLLFYRSTVLRTRRLSAYTKGMHPLSLQSCRPRCIRHSRWGFHLSRRRQCRHRPRQPSNTFSSLICLAMYSMAFTILTLSCAFI